MFGDILRYNRARARLTLYRRDPDLYGTRCRIPRDSVYRGLAVRAAYSDLRLQPRGEYTRGSFRREIKADCGALHRLSGLVRHLGNDAPAGPVACPDYRAFAFHDAYLQYRYFLLRTRSACIARRLGRPRW